MSHGRLKRFMCATGCVLSLIIHTECREARGQEDHRHRHDFFAFCFDTHDALKRDCAEQASMLKQLGFDGAGHVELVDIQQRVRTLEEVKLRLFLAGLTINLAEDPAPQLRSVETALPVLQNRDVVLYVVLRGLPAGSPDGMQPAVTALRALSDRAASAGVRIGIYPHTNDWVTTVPQAVSVAARVNRSNCGVIFNLCHFLRNEPPDHLDNVLKLARPYLFAVTLQGADLEGTRDEDWNRLIQPLDRGSFDVKRLLNRLRELDYSGPIGLMCYGIGGDAREHLSRSMAAWRTLRAE